MELRRRALKLYVDGTNLRRIARHLEVNPQTIANCVDAAAADLSAPLSVSVKGDNAELRHYLARLGRKSRRQRAKRAFPRMRFYYRLKLDTPKKSSIFYIFSVNYPKELVKVADNRVVRR